MDDKNIVNGRTITATNFNGGTFNGNFVGNGSGLTGLVINLAGLDLGNQNITDVLSFTAGGQLQNPYLNGQTLIANGNLFIRTSSPNNGYVLSSDANGLATWVSPASLSGTGDNLGNHNAEQNLNMDDKNIVNGRTITATNFNGGTFNGNFVGNGSGLTGLVINLAGLDLGNQNITDVLSFTAGGQLQNPYLNGQTLITNGNLFIRTSSPNNGYVLSSDANGLATWVSPASLSGTGDNLGNHNAEQNLNMAEKNIVNGRTITATNFNGGTFNGNFVGNGSGLTGLVINLAGLDLGNQNITDVLSFTAGGQLQNPYLNGQTLIANGNLFIRTSSPNNGYVLSSDANGLATWVSPASLSGTGDNLGNHNAEQNLNMDDKNIVNGRTITATNFNGGTFNGNFVGNGSGLTGLVINLAGLDLGNQNITDVLSFTAGGQLQNPYLNGQTLIANGNLFIRTSSPNNGYVLSSDANGLATWVSPASLSGTGDNLGNHNAEQNLNMDDKNIVNGRTITATNFNGGTFNGNFVGNGSGLTGLVINLAGLDLGNQNITDVLSFTAGGQLQNPYLNGQTLITNGNLFIRTSSPNNGYVLSSDANGLATWVSPASLSGTGDNLGNHKAEQNLNMDDKNIVNGRTITATNFNGGTFNGNFVGNGSGLTGLVINLAGLDLGNQNITDVLSFTAGGQLQNPYLNGQTLIANGNLFIRTSSPNNGYVLSSDANGLATWVSPASLSGTGDNLGNHNADTKLKYG
jgi:hypothetical protein